MKYIGSLIGEGKSRKVYEYLLDPNYVVKINNKSFTEFANPNRCEFNVFQLLDSYGLSELLAPCRMEGEHLIMLKTSPLPKGVYSVPVVFCDRPKNWGMLNNRLYRIDYGWNTEYIDNQLVIRKKINDIDLEKLSVIADKIVFDNSGKIVTIPLLPEVLIKVFSTNMPMTVA